MTTTQTLQTVPNVDLNKYAGKWYEISAFPRRFEKDCRGTTAEYILGEKGHVVVINRCKKANGEEISITGKAFIERDSNNAKLKVQFFWPFLAKYWIIELANDYSYAVVSHPDRNYLWILSRTPKMDSILYQDILVRLKNKGLDTDKLIMTEQF